MAEKKEIVDSWEAHAEFENLTDVFLNFAEQTLDAIKPYLKTILVDTPPEALIRKREMVKRLSRLFDATNTAIAHPRTGEPCVLVVNTGNRRGNGDFYMRPLELDKNGKRKGQVKLNGEVTLIPYIRERGVHKTSPESSRESLLE